MKQEYNENKEDFEETLERIDNTIMDIELLHEFNIFSSEKEFKKCEKFEDLLENIKKRVISEAYYEGLLEFRERTELISIDLRG